MHRPRAPEEKAKKAARKKAYREGDLERIRARDRAYAAANREKNAARQRAWREANREKIAAYGRAYEAANPQNALARHIKNKYRLSVEEYARLFHSQSGKCAGCECFLDLDSRGTHLDHCHATGKVRGFLCGGCNRALGGVQDNTETLSRLVAYLQKSRL